MNQELNELIKKKKRQADAGQEINWDDRRDGYLAAVSDLYDRIETILAEPIANKAVKIERRTKNLTENYIGTYAIDDLVLQIGGEQVRFSPTGRNIVGSSGRVDVVGEQDTAVLIVQTDGRWSLVATRHPTLRMVDFNESTLAQTLQRVMRD